MSYRSKQIKSSVTDVKEGTKIIFTTAQESGLYTGTVVRITAHFFILDCGSRVEKVPYRFHIVG